MVVSGINAGANLGDDVLYSGTVAAAMEGRFLGSPAIAISLNGHTATHFETAAWVAKKLVNQLKTSALPADTILNVNVPDLSIEEITGFETTRLGHRHKADPVIKDYDPRGRVMYWIGPAGEEQDAGPGTDFDAIRRGAVSVTPLHIDLTSYKALDGVVDWLKGCSLDR
jgi:5'-nucleotidase